MNAHANIHDQARGRWRDILGLIGIDGKALSGKHAPCPICGGKDRFRFDDKAGSGSFFCSHCGAGSGVDLVMKFKACDFVTAKVMIEPHIGASSIAIPKAGRFDENHESRMVAAWQRANRMQDYDAAGKYLIRRGIVAGDLGGAWPTQLRFVGEAAYRHHDESKTFHPALMAKFVSPDASSFTLHRTYLDAEGRKAALDDCRKLAPGKVPAGGAVRLAASAETMGVGEGIETCLSASIIWKVPVWACLTAGLLQKWQPPATAKNIIIFGDNDKTFAGQCAAFGLAYRLAGEGFAVEVRIPDEPGWDWNDQLLEDREINPDFTAITEGNPDHALEEIGLIEY
jgi:putative DNA primase/helicase